MRTVIILLLIFIIATPAFSGNYSDITEENIRQFIIVYDKYKTIMEDYREKLTNKDFENTKDIQQKLESLYAENNITEAEFFKLMRRIMMGYGYAQSQGKGELKDVQVYFKNSSSLSPEEIELLNKYSTDLDLFFKKSRDLVR